MPLVLSGTNGVLDNSGAFIAGTSVASTSGTSIDFTSIPSWVKRITVNFTGVSTNGSSPLQIQLGTSSGATTSGYLGAISSSTTGVGTTLLTTGLGITRTGIAGASTVVNGVAQITFLTGNTWSAFSMIGTSDGAATCYGGTSIALAAALDRVRITTVNGTDAFDAGTINILYE